MFGMPLEDFTEMCQVLAVWIGGSLLLQFLYGMMMGRKE